MNVLRDSVITHGHPGGILSAGLIALSVADLMPGGPGRLRSDAVGCWPDLVEKLRLFGELPESDTELSAYWLPQWNHPSLGSWKSAVARTVDDLHGQAERIARAVRQSVDLQSGYLEVIRSLDLRNPDVRGSGIRTALAALALYALTSLHNVTPQRAIIAVCQQLQTDTDTIATMLGSLLGLDYTAPAGLLQDRAYIAAQASRVASDWQGMSATQYPDLLTWQPPRTQADALVRVDGKPALVGFGLVTELSSPVFDNQNNFAWQWVRLPSSQVVLVKRRAELASADRNCLPTPRVHVKDVHEGEQPKQSRTSTPQVPTSRSGAQTRTVMRDSSSEHAMTSLSEAIRRVEAADYDVRVIGIQLARLAREVNPAVAGAFGSLVATELAKRGKK